MHRFLVTTQGNVFLCICFVFYLIVFINTISSGLKTCLGLPRMVYYGKINVSPQQDTASIWGAHWIRAVNPDLIVGLFCLALHVAAATIFEKCHAMFGVV